MYARHDWKEINANFAFLVEFRVSILSELHSILNGFLVSSKWPYE
jgi:hypothetical protein